MRQAGFFDIDERLKALSAKGDTLEKLSGLVDFERFRPLLAQAIPRSDGSKGGRLAYDLVFMFKVLVLQASHSLSDERTEFLIRDRLSFMRFLGLSLADPVPDANMIWTYREALTRAVIDGAPALEALFSLYEATLREAGFLAMSGQIIDATVVAAPRQRNTDAEKAILKAGEIPQDWKGKPKKLAQKDRDARGTIKYSKAKPAEDGIKRVDFAVPTFGYKNHVGIDRRYGLIRKWKVTDASRHDGAQLPALLDPNNTASNVWAIPPIGHRPMKPIWKKKVCARRSIANEKPVKPCLGISPAPTVANQRSAPVSSTSLLTRRDRWRSSYGRSVWPGQQ
jgi:transposase